MTLLVSVRELAAHLDDPTWVIFDCRHDLVDHGRGLSMYRSGHLPGAHFAPVESVMSGRKTGRNGRHPLPAPEAFAEFLASCGVTPASTIIAYDDAGGLYAARLWWLARWIGLRQVVLLDGGWQQWIAEGRAVTTDEPARTEGYLPAAAERSRWVSVDEVLARLEDPASLVIDARAAERYSGAVEPIDPLGGHIPGALNRFYRLNLRPDLTFRAAAELHAEFTTLLGPRSPTEIVHQCGSGITACANLFAMEYAGLTGSKLYAGSWSEWVSDPERPIARG